MLRTRLYQAAQQRQITACGFAPWKEQTAFVCLFPYYTGELSPLPMARFSRVPDYHRVCRRLLEEIAQQASCPEDHTIAVDSGFLPERYLAYRAGLGWIGKNGCFYHSVYGSYVFIGCLLLPVPCTDTESSPLTSPCGACDLCIQKCPGDVLGPDPDFSRCISHLTQTKTLSSQQQEQVKQSRMVWGCDACQSICPYNQNLPLTPISAFQEPILSSLPITEHHSNRSFCKAYQEYPFTWRGKEVLERNIGWYREAEKKNG